MIIIGAFPTLLSFLVYLFCAVLLLRLNLMRGETPSYLFWKKTFLYVFFFDIICFILFDISTSELSERVFALSHLILSVPLFIKIPKKSDNVNEEHELREIHSEIHFEPLLKPKEVDAYTFSRPLKAQIVSTGSKIKLNQDSATRGILLGGETGVGKKTCARLIADQAGTTLYEFNPPSILTELELSEYINQFFKISDSLLITEVQDILGWKQVKVSPEHVSLFSDLFFMTIKENKKLIIATSSNLSALDKNFKDNFSLFFEIPLPGKFERKRLIESFLNEFSLTEEINVEGFVELTESRTTKDIVKLFKKIKETYQTQAIGRHELALEIEKLLKIPA